MTMNGVMALILRYFINFGSLGAVYVNVVDELTIHLYCLLQKCSPKNILLVLYHLWRNSRRGYRKWVHYRVAPARYRSISRLTVTTDRFSPLFFADWWLSPETSKQTTCSIISVLISPQSIYCFRKAIIWSLVCSVLYPTSTYLQWAVSVSILFTYVMLYFWQF